MSALPTSPMPEPASLRAIGARVDERLATFLAAERARWVEVDDDLAAPIDALTALVSGGKRLRPGFCHWGFVAGGGSPEDERAVDAGAAFEMLQAFAVVHDDVMDGSATRRGARTAHLQFADRHARQDWIGEGRRFGEGIAILVGNLAHVYADRFMAEASDRPLAVWDELRLELNMGQYLDMVGTARRDTDPDRARLVARYKSGKYTVERPLHVGATLSDGGAELHRVLSAYGDPLGEAFQLRDDVLDVFGDAELIGKPIGGDLREGKPTALLATAIARSSPAERRVLDRAGDRDLSVEQIAEIRAVMESSGARAAIDASIAELTRRAVDAIEQAPIDGATIDALVELAYFVATRVR